MDNTMTMSTYCAKKVMKKIDIFDSVATDSKNSSTAVIQPASVSEKNPRTSAKSSKKIKRMIEHSPLLFGDSPELFSDKIKNSRAPKSKTVKGNAKNGKKTKAAVKKKETQHYLPECEKNNFSEDEQHDLFIESDERKILGSVENFKPETSKAKEPCQSLTPNGRLSGQNSYYLPHIEPVIDISESQAVSNLSIKEEEDSAKKNKSFCNITSRGRRLRPKRSIVYRDPSETTFSPVCSTPKSVNHSSGYATYHLETSGVTPRISSHLCLDNTNISCEQIESGLCELSLHEGVSQNENGKKQCHSSPDLFQDHSGIENQLYKESLGETLNTTDAEDAGRKVFQLCSQTEPITFTDCIPERMMSNCVKIGEGVYGEVFKSVSHGKQVALKIIPIEGDELVNDCPQKRFDEILPEIVIARELSDLATGEFNRSSNFCQVNRVSCVKGVFPLPLLQQWDVYAERKKSENDRPDFFSDEQLYIVFEFAHGGCALESFKFQSQCEVYSVLRQVVFALAVAEQELEFEHRDLHIGNVLVKNCEDETITFLLDGGIFSFPTEGIVATVIDFTISRLKKDGCAVFCDISTDEGLFEGTGDIQFDVYRDMRTKNENNWEAYHPETNVLWASYLCSKLLTTKKVKKSRRAERHLQQLLQRLDQEIPNYDSCADLTFTLELWHDN